MAIFSYFQNRKIPSPEPDPARKARIGYATMRCITVQPLLYDADPDPNFCFNADSEQDSDPDPDPNLKL
jgi:hypothetical protein